MVNKNIQMKVRNGSEWDNLFPLTLTENVFDNQGVSISAQLSNMEDFVNDEVTLINQSMTQLEQTTDNKLTQLETETDSKLNQFETATDNKLTQLENETDEKFNFLVKDMNMYLFNMQKRHQASAKSFTTPQGAAYVSGSGYNIQYALAFIPTDENYENHGVIINANSNNLISETSGTPLKIGHANGMEFNPKTNTFFVSHANKQDQSAGASSDNRISEVSKNGNQVLRIITPSGIPTGRRVKYYTFDKVTEKQYLGDDYGIYEVDNNFNVIRVIDFSDDYLNYKSWGLAQSGAMHNGYFFLIVGNPWTIAVFDNDGKLQRLYKVPKFTKDGFYTGAHPQDLFFDNDGNLYMTSNTESINLALDKLYTRIFKMSPFTDEAEEHFIGTHNTKTQNWVYVTPNPSSPWSLGSKSSPFHSLDEAVTYVQTAQTQQGFQVSIWLLAGTHAGSNISTNGTMLDIQAEPGVTVQGLRFYDTNVSLTGFKIVKGRYSYALLLSGSTSYIQKMVIDGLNGVTSGIYLQNGSTLYASAGTNNQNSIINTPLGLYVTASQAIGTEFNFGVTGLTSPAERSSSGYLPLFTPIDAEPE